MAHLRHPGGTWRSSGRAGTNWRGHHRHTTDRWPDTQRRVKLCPTETMSEARWFLLGFVPMDRAT